MKIFEMQEDAFFIAKKDQIESTNKIGHCLVNKYCQDEQ